MSYCRNTIVVLILICFVKPCTGQRLIFKNYSVNDGLVANNIRRIFQDSKGFLWIATLEGLSKYDGHQFKNYSTANGLSHNLINDIYESKDGKIYVATNDGSIDAIAENTIIQKAVPSTAVPNHFLHLAAERTIVTTDKNGFEEFSNGKLSKPQQPFPLYSYSSITWLNDSLFIVVAENSIQVFNRKYELFAEMKDPKPVFVDCKVYIDTQKRIWLCTYHGLKRLLVPAQKNMPVTFASIPASFNLPVIQQNAVSVIFEDSHAAIWIGTINGLVKISPDGSSQLITARHGLISDNITCIFEDNESNIWFGTASGLSKLVTKTSIRIYSTENGLWSNNIIFVSGIKNNYLLAGTGKGVQVFNKSTKEFTRAANNNQAFYLVVPNSAPPLLFGSNKLVSFDTLSLQSLQKGSYNFGNRFFYNSIASKKGDLFLSDGEGLYFFSGKPDSFVNILDYRPHCLVIDKNDNLWVGLWDKGLYRIHFKTENNEIKILAKDHYLPGESIRSLFEDSQGNIWAGTRYHGVYFFCDEKKSFPISHLDQSKGLTSNFIRCISEDRVGNIWLASYQGLDKLIRHDTAYRVFNFSGVNNYFTFISSMEPDEENSLWLATTEGMVQINDGEMEKSLPLPVYITKISSPDSIYAVSEGELNLSHKHNQLQFEFSSPGFINETQVLYSYRLAGSSNSEWTKPGNQHTVSYANLQPGSYRFEVRNKGWNGEWGNVSSFEFVILPPFWKTWWFILLVSLLAALLIYHLIKRRISQVRKEGELKQKITETEMMALRAQMNPHFIFNCLNSIDNLIQTDQKEKATDYLAKFARLIRAILENSKSNTIPCWKDLEALKLYLQMEELRWDKKIDCTVNIANEIQNGDYKVPPMIIQPFVENAIHHGLLNKIAPDKKLSIDVKLEGNKIKYTITDNGVGRVKATEYKKLNRTSGASFGMQITKDRINLFNQDKNGSVKITDLYNEQQQPDGTMVEVWLTTQPITT